VGRNSIGALAGPWVLMIVAGMISRLLKKAGASVVPAANGRVAVERAEGTIVLRRPVPPTGARERAISTLPSPEPAPAPPSPTADCTSEEALFSEFAGDVDMAEIIDLFVDELPGRMDELRSAIADGATADVKRLAHRLKGAAGGYGFGPITAVAGELELAIGRGEGAAETQEIVGRLLAMCARARPCEPVAEAV